MPTDEPWMRPYVLSITGLFLEDGFARLAEALGRLDKGAGEAALARFEDIIRAQIADIGEQDDIPPAVLVDLRRNIETRMASVFAKARQRMTAPVIDAVVSAKGQADAQGLATANQAGTLGRPSIAGNPIS